MLDAACPVGFTWTPTTGMLAGQFLEHGHEIIAQPGRKRALRFSPVWIQASHPFSEGGRYQCFCPVMILDEQPLLAAQWEQWASRKGKAELLEVFTGPRTRHESQDTDHYEQARSTMAKAELMTSELVPPAHRWGAQKLSDTLAALGLSEEAYESYRTADVARWI